MRNFSGVFVSCVIACALLSGCSLPGTSSQADDDYINEAYYSSSTESTEKTQNYKWIVEPTITADNIISFDSSQIDGDNETNTAYINVSVIYQDGLYGFIDYSGNITVQPKYKYFYTCPCGEIVLYNIIDEQAEEYEYCTVDSAGQVLSYVKNHYNTSTAYYWNSDEQAIYEKDSDSDYAVKYTGKKTVVVTTADFNDAGNGYYTLYNVLNTSFALAKEDELITDFDYEDYYAPAYKGAGITAIALKKDGKWGYVSSSGEQIIDFECDSILSSYNGTLIDDETSSHPYLFCEGLVPVSVGAKFGYYNIDGECVVAPGEFEQARPVHNGRAWVRKDGKWGVIQLGEIVEESEADSSSLAETTTTTTTTYYRTYSTTAATEEIPEETTAETTQVTTSSATTTTAVSTSETTASATETTTATTTTAVETEAPTVSEDNPPVAEPDPTPVAPDPSGGDAGEQE